MNVTITPLSSTFSNSWSSGNNEFLFKQFRRTYSGGFSFNFVSALSGFNDFKSKNYTNFSLSTRKRADELFDINNSSFSSDHIYTFLQFGEKYLTSDLIDTTPYKEANKSSEGVWYRKVFFSEKLAYLSIIFLSDSICKISTKIQKDNFVLASDVDDNVFYINQTQVNDSLSANQPHHFKYMFDTTRKFLFLFQDKESGFYTLGKQYDRLVLEEVTSENKENIIGNKIFIGKNKVYDPGFSLDTSFITYENDSNHIDEVKSDFGLRNNYLMHNKPLDFDRVTDVIVLKNQMGNFDTINSGNNLLSGSNSYYVNDYRNYTSISETIPSETSTSIELNYVFYNKDIIIKPGNTDFVCPSSMFPFTKLNINDVKLSDVGAFSYSSPEYADKVWKKDDNVPTHSNQFYLCTWLSGSPLSPLSNDKVWVDRYYYPDLISKAAALSSKPIFSETYNDAVEALIMANSTLKSSIINKKIFDKKSDLTFEPNKRYTYERISPTTFESIKGEVGYCSWSDLNYFKDINKEGSLTFGFYFNGDSDQWVVQSDRNNINAGLKITKTSSNAILEYNIYDSTTSELYEFSKTVDFIPGKENFVLFSIDLLNGEGYWFFNNETVLDISLIPTQFRLKQLLYGDIYILIGSNKTSIISKDESTVNNVILTTDIYSKDLAFVTSILNGKTKIDDITLSLPCGMRNNIDDIDLLQSICGNTTNKSNNINITVKNLNVSNQSIKNGLSSLIVSEINKYIPTNNTLNTLTFINYK